jgi:hypothetical protein
MIAFPYRKQGFSVDRCMESKRDKESRRLQPPSFGKVDLDELTRRDGLRKMLDGFSGMGTHPLHERREEQVEHAMNVLREIQGMQAKHSEERDEEMWEEDLPRYCGLGQQNLIGMDILTMRELARKGIFGALIARVGLGEWYGGFDDHQDIVPRMRKSGPALAHAMAELIKDVKEGVLGDAVIVYAGEFGRTPVINNGAGRDHHANGDSVFIVGSELRKGAVYGSTDRRGEARDGTIDDETFAKIILQAAGAERDFELRARYREIFR